MAPHSKGLGRCHGLAAPLGGNYSPSMDGSVNLGREMEAYVDRLVRDGRYGSRTDVLRAGVEMIHAKDAFQAEIDEALREGLADIEAGRVHDADEVFDALIAKYTEAASRK